MDNAEKRKVALNKIAGVFEKVIGVDVDDFTEDKIFGDAPEGMKKNDPKYKDYLGADQIDMLKSMLYLEEAFNKEVEDNLFVPRKDVVLSEMWRERPVGDLVSFCVETLFD